MNKEIENQREFWDNEVGNFDAIYTHNKSEFQVLMDKIFRKDMYQRFEFTMENAEPLKGKTILDVGCGSAQYSVEFAKRGADRVIGLDISDNMIKLSSEYARHNGVESKCEFIKSDLLEYSSDIKFDVTIGIGLFDYIKEPLHVIRKMRDVTSGKVIMSFPRLFTWRAPVRKVRLAVKNCEVYFYTKNRIKSILNEAGLEVDRIDKVGKLYCVTAISN